MKSSRKSYRKKLYSGGQNVPAQSPASGAVDEGITYRNTGAPAPAPAPAPAQASVDEKITNPMTGDTTSAGILSAEKIAMINNIQNALKQTDPTILTQMDAMQGSSIAIQTGKTLSDHINDPANQNETLQQLYSYCLLYTSPSPRDS